MSLWLSESEWQEAERNLPILCVDVMPLRLDKDHSKIQIGLILRETPHQGRRWCLIGGRVLRGEILFKAIQRQWIDALGESLPFGEVINNFPQIVEYRPDALPGRPHDPRKHAVSATYEFWTDGEGHPQGEEAIDFKWFEFATLNGDFVGFGQEIVIQRLIALVVAP